MNKLSPIVTETIYDFVTQCWIADMNPHQAQEACKDMGRSVALYEVMAIYHICEDARVAIEQRRVS
jgi:hypothetical protein